VSLDAITQENILGITQSHNQAREMSGKKFAADGS
jgi:hypothetical protein